MHILSLFVLAVQVYIFSIRTDLFVVIRDGIFRDQISEMSVPSIKTILIYSNEICLRYIDCLL